MDFKTIKQISDNIGRGHDKMFSNEKLKINQDLQPFFLWNIFVREGNESELEPLLRNDGTFKLATDIIGNAIGQDFEVGIDKAENKMEYLKDMITICYSYAIKVNDFLYKDKGYITLSNLEKVSEEVVDYIYEHNINHYRTRGLSLSLAVPEEVSSLIEAKFIIDTEDVDKLNERIIDNIISLCQIVVGYDLGRDYNKHIEDRNESFNSIKYVVNEAYEVIMEGFKRHNRLKCSIEEWEQGN